MRPIDARWQRIAGALPFAPRSALHLGAAEGELSIRLATTFGTRVVAIEAKGAGFEHPLVDWRVGRVNTAQLRQLDRVDVAFALSVLHHFPDWAAAWWALNEIADWIVVEVPHPDEGASAQRMGVLPWLLDLVTHSGAKLIGQYPGGKTALPRRTYLVRTAEPIGIKGTVKSGRGKTARQLPHVPGLNVLGYEPYPGSLGMDLAQPFDHQGRGVVTVSSRYGDYLFTPARLSGLRCHVMRPPRGKNRLWTAEVTAPVRARQVLGLDDGAPVWLA